MYMNHTGEEPEPQPLVVDNGDWKAREAHMYYSIATPVICLKPLVCATSPRLHGPAALLHLNILCIPSQSRGSVTRPTRQPVTVGPFHT
jgi:hypothetical protein